MKKFKINIDGKSIEVNEKKSILEICRERGIKIPTLCYHKSLPTEARCRICLVEMNGKLVTSCSTKPVENANIITNSERVIKARKMNLELMSPSINVDELGNDFEAKKIYEQIGLDNERFKQIKDYPHELGAAIVRNNNICVNCGRCVKVCGKIQEVYAIDFASRAHNEHVTPYDEKQLEDIACIRCGQCIIN
jgi:NADH dehydrogenase/NADH:ubiquinone oxidoreductase subunit G